MKRNKKKRNTTSILLEVQRNLMIEQGAYDGRYNTKIIPNKKKEWKKCGKMYYNEKYEL